MPSKILKLVSSCGECPHHIYYSGGAYICELTKEVVVDKKSIAPFCPLTDFPSKIIADMEGTIRALREPNKHDLSYAILSYMASKLKVTMSARGVITLQLKTGESLQLWYENIIAIETRPYALHFFWNDKKYKLITGREHIEIFVEVKHESYPEPLWQQCQLA